MKNFLKKKINFENCLYILFCLLGIGYGIYAVTGDLTGVRIFSSNVTGIILLVISSICFDNYLTLRKA